MMQFLVAAPCSGSGKTTLTCALLAALKRRGADPCAFKSGPDYIDPMFHRAVLGVESHNLDLFFSAPDTVRALYAPVSYTHLRAHETDSYLVCRLLLEKKKDQITP